MDRQRLMARVISGVARVKLGGSVYFLARPTLMQLYEAEEVYAEELESCEGMFDQNSLKEWMRSQNLWSGEDDVRVKNLPLEIEDAKVGIFDSAFRSNERAKYRQLLARLNDEYGSLLARLHRHDSTTASGAADMARVRFLTACCLRYNNGTEVFPSGRYLNAEVGLLDEAISELTRTRPSEKSLRDLSHNEPWRSVWCCRKSGDSLFGTPAAEYTQEQRSLVAYSSLYDSVFDHSDCPADEVIDDDDCLDGWLIKQRRNKGGGGPQVNVKGDAQEVYLPVDSAEDAKRVMQLNSPEARATIRRRAEEVRKKGSVGLADMPDVKEKFRREAAKAARK